MKTDFEKIEKNLKWTEFIKPVGKSFTLKYVLMSLKGKNKSGKEIITNAYDVLYITADERKQFLEEEDFKNLVGKKERLAIKNIMTRIKESLEKRMTFYPKHKGVHKIQYWEIADDFLEPNDIK